MSKNHEEKISELIAATSDPVQRATLLILSKIDVALESNTNATERIAVAFDTHRQEFILHDRRETEDRAAIKGAWWAGVIFMSVLQLLGGYILTRHLNTNDTQDVRLGVLEQRLIVLESLVREHAKRDGEGP